MLLGIMESSSDDEYGLLGDVAARLGLRGPAKRMRAVPQVTAVGLQQPTHQTLGLPKQVNNSVVAGADSSDDDFALEGVARRCELASAERFLLHDLLDLGGRRRVQQQRQQCDDVQLQQVLQLAITGLDQQQHTMQVQTSEPGMQHCVDGPSTSSKCCSQQLAVGLNMVAANGALQMAGLSAEHLDVVLGSACVVSTFVPVPLQMNSAPFAQPVNEEVIIYKMTGLTRTGAILEHCCKVVDNIIGHGPTIYKIGITQCPKHRFDNKEYGYKFDKVGKWQKLVVIAVLPNSCAAGMLEAALLHKYLNTSGCWNVQSGGEGVPASVTVSYYTYIVYWRLDKPAPLKC